MNRARLTTLVTAVLFALVGVPAAFADDPTLYIHYTMNCTFTVTGDNGATISTVPPGRYQVLVSSPQSFAEVDLSGVADPTYACGGFVSFQKLDIAAAIIASIMVATLAVFFQRTRIGRALRAVADSHKAALSVGISLEQIWVIVWFAAGLVALVTGIFWGARSDVSFALDVIALKALPVLILGGLTSIPGAIVGGLIIGIGEKMWEFYWGPLIGGGTDAWFAYVIALVFLLFKPQGLFGEKIIERV